MERGLVQRVGPVPGAGHCPISEDGVTHVRKIIGKPYAGKPHVRIERGMGKRTRESTAPLTTNGVFVPYHGGGRMPDSCRITVRLAAGSRCTCAGDLPTPL